MLKDKEYVYAVYQEKSFSKAAKKLFVSQPALSATIKKVEAKVQLPLFDRSSSPIRLTQAGEYYIQSIEKVLEIEREMQETFAALVGQRKGVLSIGGSAFFCGHVLPALTQKFSVCYPGYTMNLVEANVVVLTDQLQDGTLDFTIDVEALNQDVFDLRVIDQEHIVLAVPQAYPINERLAPFRFSFGEIADGSYLDERRAAVSLSQFREEPFLLMKKGNDSYQRGMKMCRNAGFSPRVVMHFDQLLTSYYIARSGSGIAFVRAGLTHYVEPSDSLCFYKIDDPLARRNIMIYFKRCDTQSQAAMDFLDFLERETKGERAKKTSEIIG